MATCPVCSSEIKDDFGLVTCPSCGAQVMVEIDGSSPSQSIPSEPALETEDEVALSMPLVPPPLEVPLFSDELSRPVEMPPATPDMSDIADFGNSVASQGREGMLRFNLFISGIDSADIRNMILDALMDDRFLWDAEKILSEMVNGQLHLKEITAVKSALLVQKLRAVPVEIRWEQHAIYQNS